MGDLGSIPGLGRSPGEGKGYPVQYSDLENPMDCMVHWVTKSGPRLSDFHFTSYSSENELLQFVKTDEPNKHTAEQKKQLQKSRQCMIPFTGTS